MSTEQIRRDLGRDLQQSVAELVARKLAVAAAVLPTKDVAVIMIETAVSVTLTTAATIALHSIPDQEGEAFDAAIGAIHTGAKADRERSLAKVATEKVSA